MRKYAIFREDGTPNAFYAEDVQGDRMRPVYGEPPVTPGEKIIIGYEDDEHTKPIIHQMPDTVGEPPIIGEESNPNCKIPVDAVEITHDQWQEFLMFQGQRKWDGKKVVEYKQPIPDVTTVDVNNERQRRILAGTTVDGVRVTGTDNDTRNLMGLALGAQLRLAGGDNETITTFRDGDNIDHDLTPEQVLNLWQKSTAFVSMLYQKSWAIKALEPIPSDYNKDKYWG